MVSIVAYQDYQDQDYQDQWMDMDYNKKKKLYFHTVGLSAHAHNNYCARGQSSQMAAFLELKNCTLLLFSDSCS